MIDEFLNLFILLLDASSSVFAKFQDTVNLVDDGVFEYKAAGILDYISIVSSCSILVRDQMSSPFLKAFMMRYFSSLFRER